MYPITVTGLQYETRQPNFNELVKDGGLSQPHNSLALECLQFWRRLSNSHLMPKSPDMTTKLQGNWIIAN